MASTYDNLCGVPHLAAGEWAWYLDPVNGRYLAFGCPCGKQPKTRPTIVETDADQEAYMHYGNGMIRVYRSPEEKIAGGETNSGWLWDGNEQAPTLTPSFQRHTECKWHGFLRAGKFVSA